MTEQIKIISLKNQKEFNAVNKLGKKIYSKHFIMVYAKECAGLLQNLNSKTNSSNVYLGLKVSRKVGNAVKRNKIKRRFREIARQIVKDNPEYNGYSFIFIPKHSFTTVTYQESLENISTHLKKIN